MNSSERASENRNANLSNNIKQAVKKGWLSSVSNDTFSLLPDGVSEAQKIADGLVQRKIPLVTTVFDVKRVLNPKLEYSDKVLLLMYDSLPKPVSVNNLFEWTEHKNITDFKRKVLQKLHDTKFIEYRNNLCVLLEPGQKYVEENFVPS